MKKIGTKQEEKTKGILTFLKSILKKKYISRIYVYNGTQKFWVSNPKKIEEYLTRANSSASGALNLKTVPGLIIKKVVYK